MSHRILGRITLLSVLAAVWLGPTTPIAAAAPKIVFLDQEAAAKAIINDVDDDDPYFELLQPLEMSAKSGRPLTGDLSAQRNEFGKRYSGAARVFSAAEKEMIRASIESIHPYLEKHYSVLGRTTWSFLKVTTEVESGLPHTRGDHIVLSEMMLQWLAGMPEENASKFLPDLLVHELMHVAQRDHAERFDELYTDVWGLREVVKITGDEWFVENQVINPDGPNRWLFRTGEGDAATWLWPTLLLEAPESGQPNIGRDMRMIAVTVDEKNGAFSVRQAEGQPVYGPLMEDSAFTAAFSYTANRYHPHETTADVLAKIVLAGISEADPPSGEGVDILREWFSKNLHEASDP